ncbi:MAG: precorrin-2 dehydrogenase/sirohydrochlorin ferrochelatase family protein [Acidimicrobiales bacterium]
MTDSIATSARADRAEVAISSPMPIVPVGLRVDGKPVLVVGAGRIAARKAAALVDQGALVTVVAPDHSDEMNRVAVTERRYRSFEPSDLDEAWFVITATGVRSVDGAVFAEAEARRIWCNAADDPKRCSVILPAVTRRGPITIAISSGGTSPAAASWIKRRIQQLLDDETVAVAEIATRVRDAVKGTGLPTEVPGWAEVLDNEAIDLFRSGTPEELERRLFEAVAEPPDQSGAAAADLGVRS